MARVFRLSSQVYFWQNDGINGFWVSDGINGFRHKVAVSCVDNTHHSVDVADGKNQTQCCCNMKRVKKASSAATDTAAAFKNRLFRQNNSKVMQQHSAHSGLVGVCPVADMDSVERVIILDGWAFQNPTVRMNKMHQITDLNQIFNLLGCKDLDWK
jgi:hypothetical protein